MRVRWFCIAATLLMASAASSQSVVDNSGAGIEPATLARMLTVVSDQLRDPETSRFRRITIGNSSTIKAICGEVNGKNAMGAYSGYATFIFFTQTGAANIYDQGADNSKLVAERDADLKEAGCPTK